MKTLPLRKNVVALTTLAMIAALGAVVRLVVRIPVIPEWLELTPGFMFSELGGIIGGVPGGILVGAVVGMGGAFAGVEVPILPMIGNICLGIGTGYAIHVTSDRDDWKYWAMVVVGGAIIGGFIPTMTILASATDAFELSVIYAMIDAAQAALWAVAALILEKSVIRPIIGSYLYPNLETETTELQDSEVS